MNQGASECQIEELNGFIATDNELGKMVFEMIREGIPVYGPPGEYSSLESQLVMCASGVCNRIEKLAEKAHDEALAGE